MAKAIKDAITPYPKPAGLVYEYGTAGFRMKADQGLDHVVFTVGLMAALRSKKCDGAVIGVMITASHNPAEDNGVKIVDPAGEMLEASWEVHATTLANLENDQVAKGYEDAFNVLLADAITDMRNQKSRVVFARDSRESGPHLVAALKAALIAVDVEFQDYGYLTTPQLHYMVRCHNYLKSPQYYFGKPTEEGYYEKMADSFKKVISGRTIKGSLTVDCANGIGGPKLRQLLKYLPSAKDGGIDIKVINDDVITPTALNHDCGADYVKTRQRAPPSSKAGPLERCCSLDGDADRVVYYFVDDRGVFTLLDGDRIATLAALFIAEQVRAAGLEGLQIGVVQTAYANGASTEYINKVLKLDVECASTGVKHLHAAAHRFDIGVYFEANGHGTVLFSDETIQRLKTTSPTSPTRKHALETLVALTDLINQAVGDALSDMLLTEVALAAKSWTPVEWKNTYIDLPNRLVKVSVADRGIFKTEYGERRLIQPEGCQEQIDLAVRARQGGRSFARASGTENAVRVYAEAYNQEDAESLARQVGKIVEEFGK